MNKNLLKLWLPLLALLGVNLASAAKPSPNIILVMTDDQGWAEVGFNGNKAIETPNLDRFAAESLQLSQFYVSPMCTPTRSSLMTGRYHYRTGAHDTYIGRTNMNPGETTIAEVFADAGYRTGIFGKWHLGENYPMRAQDQGFHDVVVHGGGGLGQFADYPRNSNYSPTLLYQETYKPSDGYCTDVFIDESIRFIEENKDKPFFCYVPLNAPHAPFTVDQEYSGRYKGKITEKGRQWTPGIYGMITQLDEAFQRLLDSIKANGLEENTIVIFTTDNGPNSTFFTAGLRAKKGSVYENGFRVPFAIRWPAAIEGGRKLSDPALHIDLLPTLAKACQIPVPKDLQLDGKNILPLLTGEKDKLEERYIFMQHNRGNVPVKYKNGMARKGPWKVVGNGNPETFELYNIDQDPGEKNNLAAKHPDKVKTLVAEYDKWFDDVTAELMKSGGAPHPFELHPAQSYDYRLTWQDWFGDKTGWQSKNYGRWHVTNPGLIDRFDITFRTVRNTHGAPSELKFIWQDQERSMKFKSTPDQILLEDINLRKGTGWMEAQVIVDGKVWPVQEIQIRPHGVESVIKFPETKNKPKSTKKSKQVTTIPKLTKHPLPKEVKGQFVRIELPGGARTLSLAEVMVFEKGVNKALNLKASQSSTSFGGKPELAVDGNTNGDYHSGSVTHTENDKPNPWWEIDLGKVINIDEIAIANRTDSNGARLEGFTLKVLNAKREEVFTNKQTPQSSTVQFIKDGIKSAAKTNDAKLFPGEKTNFRGYDRYDRIKTAHGHFSVVCPKEPAPGKPWLWRSLFWEAIKQVSDADLKLVDEGYHVVLAHGDVAGHPKGNANISAAYDLLTTEHGFAKTCSMSSMSRGTLSLFRWATENPEKVNSIYVDNGVCNVLSWPAGKLVPGNNSIASGAPSSWEDFKKKFGYKTDAEALKTKESPIDLLEPLAKAKLPILLVCGNKDKAVPYEENDAILEKRYKALGGDVTVIVENKGHSHGMKDPTPVLEFIRAHSSDAKKQASHAEKANGPLVYEGKSGSGLGKHIVFLANDHEYRSEQTCPAIARILAKHHGFRCTVLFGMNDDGQIHPGGRTVPGLEALKEADMLFLFSRFMNLPDEQVDHLADYFERGGPVVALRTSSHSFNGQSGKWAKLNYNHKGDDYPGGLGQNIVGVTWTDNKNGGQGHYGENHSQGSRITITESAASHPILTGVGEMHGYSGAYSSPVPPGAASLIELQVLNSFQPGGEPAKNKPIKTAGWYKNSYTAPSGTQKKARVVYTPFGASEDILDENMRRFLTNASFWAIGMEKQITPDLKVSLVGKYRPSPYSTGSLYFKGVSPSQLAGWESSIMPATAELVGVDQQSEKGKQRLERVFKNRPKMATDLLGK